MTVDVWIAHALWDERRAEPLKRLVEQVGGYPVVCVSGVREHANVWATRLWKSARKSEASHVVFLNDDVTVCPDFRKVCGALVEAVPDQVIALHTSIPANAQIPSWQRSYWLTGPGYIIPRGQLEHLVEFAHDRREWFVGHVNEDGLIMQWAWHRQRPIWHCIPAPVKHDATVPSTLGYDGHAMRVTNVPWDAFGTLGLDRAEVWAPFGPPPVVTCPWMREDQFRAIEARKGGRPVCAFCHSLDTVVESHVTGAALCGGCVSSCATLIAGGRQG